MLTLIIVGLCIITMILSFILFPKLKIGKIELDTYYLITLAGAIILLLCNRLTVTELGKILFEDDGMNPIKIIVLFLSMAFLSIYLDKLGFFKYLAVKAAMRFKSSQKSLFLALFILISTLTVFPSNDIIILTFTPFICYFCKNTKINPIPYLIGEFFAANTLSMTLIIGNPTNIYIASNAGITFVEYFEKMFLVGFLTATLLCFLLLIVFRKSLSAELTEVHEDSKIKSKFLLIMGLIHLLGCTLIMAISNYINIEMYLVSLCFALSLLFITIVYYLIIKKPNKIVVRSLKELPFPFIPFLLSMVVLISALSKTQFIEYLSKQLAQMNSPITYGVSSLLLGNLLNNIPMSMLFSEIFQGVSISSNAIYAVIAASNLCALLTPLGSLAGMMFISLVKQQDVNFTFIKFMKYGFIDIILTIFTFALIVLL